MDSFIKNIDMSHYKRWFFSINVILLGFTNLLSVNAQSAQSDSLFAIGVDLYNEGKYQEAIPLFAKSDSLDKTELDSTSNRRNYSAMWLASCYYHLGDTIKASSTYDSYYMQPPVDRRITIDSDLLTEQGYSFYISGELEEALDCWQKCAKLELKNIGRHYFYANSLCNCMGLMWILKRYTEAIQLGEEALKIREETLSKEHPVYANLLHNLAKCQSHLGNYTEAVRLGEEALRIREKTLGKEHPDYANSIHELAIFQSHLGNYTEAVKLVEETLRIREKTQGKEHPDYATSLNNLALYQYKLGNYTEAVKLEEEALRIREKTLGKEHPDYANSLNNLSLFQYKSGNYTEAVKLVEEALRIREKTLGKEHPDYANSLSNLATCQSHLGNFTEAVRLGEDALKIREKTLGKEHPDYASSLNDLAISQYNLGNYTEAIKLVEEALKIREKTLGKEHPDYSSSLSNLANYQSELGNYTEAVRLGEEALRIREKTLGKEHSAYANSLSNLAEYQFDLGNYTEAVRLEEEALRIREKTLGKEHPDYANSLHGLALFQSYLGNYTKAARLGEESLRIYEKKFGKEHPAYATTLNNLASNQYYLGNYTGGFRLEEEALKILEKTLGEEHAVYANSLMWMCRFLFLLSKTGGLSFYAAKASEILKSKIMHSFLDLNTYSRHLLWEKHNQWFQSDLCILANRFPTDSLTLLAYDGLLFSKGLLLNSEIEIKKLIAESGDAETQKLYGQMYMNKLMLQKLYEKPIQEITLNTDSLVQVIDGQEKQLMSRIKAYGDYTKNLRVNWKDVHQKLQDDDVSIEFVSFHLNTDSVMYMAFVLQKGMKILKMIKLFEEKQLQGNDKLNTTANASKLIWEPLANYLNGAKNVYFAPSGELYNIPIESLPHWSENCLMSDKWNMYRLSSTRELAVVKDKSKLRHAAVYGGVKYNTDTDMLVADSRKFKANERSFDVVPFNLSDSLNLRSGVAYLPATKVEAEEIDKTLEKKKITTMLRMDTLATEGDFKNLSGKRTNLLHIATHGFYWTEREAQFRNDLDFLMLNDRRPRYVEDKALTRSGLLLAGANNALMGKKLPEGVDDGILTAKEISQLDLRGLDLVVLSACQTGLGEIKGDGVFGLQRGFKKAGANSIMMSLWKVDDEATRLLMTQFYKNLTSGMSKYESLKQAQKYVREYEVEIEVKSDEKKHLNANQNEQARKDATKVKEYKKIRKYEDPYYWAAFILLDALD